MIFSVTYLLEQHNDIPNYHISHILPTNVKLVVWTLYNINNFTWLKSYNTSGKKNIALCKSK